MLSQTPASKLPRARLALALTLVLALSGAAAPVASGAQRAKKSPTRTAQRGASAAKAGEKPATRARRVGAQPPAASAAANPATGDAKAAQGGAESKTDGAAEGAAETKTAAEPKAETVEAELSRRRAEIEAAKPEKRASLQRALADRLVELNMSGEALSELRLMVHEDRYDPAFFFNTGNALARLGDSNAAADAYRKAVSQRKGNYARALNNLGVVLTRQGRWDEAYDALNAALTQENFTYAEASYNLGRLHMLRGATNLAIREWTRTLRLAPSHVEATAALALAYAQDGDEKRGLAVLEKFTARAAQIGGTVPREIAYARDEINSGVEREAPGGDGAFAPNTPAPVVGTTGAKPATRVVAPAASSAPAARPAAPARSFSVDPVTYAMLRSARDAGDEGKYEEAVKRYRGVLSRNGGYLPPANLELGLALINLKRNDEAIAALTPVAERNGARYPVVHYHLARLYEQQNQLELSARHFARAAALYADSAPQMLLDLSRVREKSGDAGGALSAMESFVTSIGRQGSIPDWATERLNALREKAKGATPQAKP